jgi:V8-like Glu-specific endopeptidase
MPRRAVKEFRFPPISIAPKSSEPRRGSISRQESSMGRRCNCGGCGGRPSVASFASLLAGNDKKRRPFCDDTKNSKCDQDAIKFIWGCDNRTSGPTSLETIKSTPPWQHIGQTSTGGTGCLIASTFVLTAAHAIVGGDGLPYSDKMVFSAGFSNGKCALGSRWVNRAWIPTQYKKGSSKEVKCYDWGIVRIDSEIATPSMAFDAIPVADIKAKPIFSVGYPGSLTQIMWSTGANQKVIDDFEDPQGGGLLRTTLDGEGGQSGSPVYIFQGNTRVIVGVLVGAPNCAEGANWVALINDDVRGKIKAVIDTGTTPEGLKHFVFKTDVLPPGCGTTDVLETGF